MFKAALIGLLSAFAFWGLAHAEEPQPTPPDPSFTIKLHASEWNVVLNGLGKLPLEVALPIVNEMQAQAHGQSSPPPVQPDKPKK